jgi:hypothetical protein
VKISCINQFQNNGVFLNFQSYTQTRPYLFHLTHRDNLEHIREIGRLFPAAVLMEQARCTDLIRVPRRAPVRLVIGTRTIVLRDQAPLYKGKMKLPRGYTFELFVESLNRRIFFWPGGQNGPIDYGIRHFECYQDEKPIILRVDFQSLCQVNHAINPLFCRYNSGSPRVSYGKKSPRGPDTFISADNFSETPSKVVEVTFDAEIAMPRNTQFATNPRGPWRSLF